MTKEEIVKKIIEKTGISREEVSASIKGLMSEIKASLSEGENVYLRGFGSFIVKHRKEKTARNISRNTSLIIPAHDIPAFKPAKDFENGVK